MAASAALKDTIAKANELVGDRAWFVCDGCNKLILGRGHYLSVTKWGDAQRVFCTSCTGYCKPCNERYAPGDYRHEDCVPPEDSDEE